MASEQLELPFSYRPLSRDEWLFSLEREAKHKIGLLKIHSRQIDPSRKKKPGQSNRVSGI